jgi:hypothetical protein
VNSVKLGRSGLAQAELSARGCPWPRLRPDCDYVHHECGTCDKGWCTDRVSY